MKRNNGSDEGEGRGGSGHVANYGGKGFREEQCSRREISYCFASSFYSRSFLFSACTSLQSTYAPGTTGLRGLLLYGGAEGERNVDRV